MYTNSLSLLYNTLLDLRTNRGTNKTSSSLSYEFYQVMVGDPRMKIHGWKQLAEWSLEHSCLSEKEIERAKEIHAREWEAFCQGWVTKYKDVADALGELP